MPGTLFVYRRSTANLLTPGATMTDSAVLLQQVINGLSLGAMYALLALGFTLVYGILELINFAHFNVFMVASFIGMWALQLLGISGQTHVLSGAALAGALAFAFFVTMAAAGVIGVVIERLSLRPLRGVGGTAAMITTIGVSYILFNVILLTVGAGSENYPNPLPVIRWQFGAGDGGTEGIADLGGGCGADDCASPLCQPDPPRQGDARDRAGCGGRANDGRQCRPGHRHRFFLGSALAGAAALIFGLYYNYTSFIIGYTAGLRAFTAAVLGGIGRFRARWWAAY